MEGALFSNDIFRHEVEDGLREDADELNEETFGLGDDDDLFQPNDDWEKQHQVISKIIEGGSVVRNSPLKQSSLDTAIPARNGGPGGIASIERHNISLSDAEEEMIETTINSLGLDDDSQYEVKHNTPTKAMSFEESHLSWNSPIRGKEHRSDSLQELISPGDGVWASPSRDIIWTPPSREGMWPAGPESSLWSSPARGSDDLKASPLRLDDVSSTGELQEPHQYNGNIVRKLISTNNEDASLESNGANGAVFPQPPGTPSSPGIQNHSAMPSPTPVMSAMPTTPVMSAIRVEDLEREMKKGGDTQQQQHQQQQQQLQQPTIIERRHSMTSPVLGGMSPAGPPPGMMSPAPPGMMSPAPPGMMSPAPPGMMSPGPAGMMSPGMLKSPIPYPMFSPKELHMKNMLSAGLNPNSPMDMNAMTSFMMNQQMMAQYAHMMNAAAAAGGPAPPPPSPLLPPPPGHPLLSPYQQQHLQQQQQQQQKQHQQRSNSPRYHDSNDRYQKNSYRRGNDFSQRSGDYDRHFPKHVWHKELHPSKFKEIDYEQFIQMDPSGMMNAKEKKWIFKIRYWLKVWTFF